MESEGGAQDWDFNFFQALNRLKDGNIETCLLGYTTMAGADPFTHVVRNYIVKCQPLNRMWQNVISKDGMVPKEKLDQFEQRSIAHFGSDYIHRLTPNSSDADYTAVKHAITHSNLKYGIIFKPYNSWTQLASLEQVLQMLPPYSVLLLLVRIYFKFQEKWLPVLDEKGFFFELNRVVGPTLNGQCAIRSFDSPQDAAIAASLLLIVRLAYTVVIHSKTVASVSDRELILQHPVPIDAVEVAGDLLKEVMWVSNVGKHGLRALMVLQTYYTFSPENGLITEAISSKEIMRKIHSHALALHLDMDHLNVAQWRWQYGKEAEDSRILWDTIKSLDIYTSVLYQSENTVKPELDLVNEPYSEEALDNEQKELYSITRPVVEALLDLIASTTPYACSLRYTELTAKIEHLEEAITQNLGDITSYLSPLGDGSLAIKCAKFFLLIMSKSWLQVLFSALYLFFENNDELDLSVKYLVKRFRITHKDFGFLKSGILTHIEEYFGSGLLLLLVPLLTNAISSQLGAGGFRIRLECSSRTQCSDDKEMSAIKSRHFYNLIILIICNAENSALELSDALSESFHQAWAIARSTRFGQRMIAEESLFTSDLELTQKAAIKYSVKQLRDVEQVFNEADIEQKLYSVMLGEDKGGVKDEGKDLRLLNALQMEKKWSLVQLIQKYNQKRSFLKRAGTSLAEPATTEPLETWKQDLALLQEYDPQLLMEFFEGGLP